MAARVEAMAARAVRQARKHSTATTNTSEPSRASRGGNSWPGFQRATENCAHAVVLLVFVVVVVLA